MRNSAIMLLAAGWLCAGVALGESIAVPGADAGSGNVTAKDPAALGAVMKEFGYPVEMGTDTQGDPKIMSQAGGEDVTVLFYGCTDGKDCSYILLQSVWLSDTYSIKNADDWNGIGIYGQAAVGDGNPSLSMMINLSEDGVSKSNFKDSLERWTRAVQKFSEDVASKK